MPQVRLSKRAHADLSRLYNFLRVKDISVAQRALLAIRQALTPLKHSPAIGRPVEEHDNLRELMIDFGASGYLVMYRFEPNLDAVTILAVKHQREDGYQ